jgi:hypothetical protein
MSNLKWIIYIILVRFNLYDWYVYLTRCVFSFIGLNIWEVCVWWVQEGRKVERILIPCVRASPIESWSIVL